MSYTLGAQPLESNKGKTNSLSWLKSQGDLWKGLGILDSAHEKHRNTFFFSQSRAARAELKLRGWLAHFPGPPEGVPRPVPRNALLALHCSSTLE